MAYVRSMSILTRSAPVRSPEAMTPISKPVTVRAVRKKRTDNGYEVYIIADYNSMPKKDWAYRRHENYRRDHRVKRGDQFLTYKSNNAWVIDLPHHGGCGKTTRIPSPSGLMVFKVFEETPKKVDDRKRRLSHAEYEEIIGRRVDAAKAGPTIDITNVPAEALHAFLRAAGG